MQTFFAETFGSHLPSTMGINTVAGIIDLAKRESKPKDPADFWRQHTIKAILWPKAWREATVGHSLNWKCVKFSRANAKEIPTNSGVYAFSISIKGTIIPPQGPIVYFGKSLSLRKRFLEYIGERDRGSKRIVFGELFELWPNDLDFYFATVNAEKCSLDQVEQTLNDTVIPQFVTNDFSAEICRKVRLFRGK